MKFIKKHAKKACGLLIVGPFVGIYTLLSKHWLLNSVVGLTLLAGGAFPNLPLLLTFYAGYAMSASLISLAQQAYAFAINVSLGQCETMSAPIVPEISYAALRGIGAANYVAAKAESEYQNKDISDVGLSDIFYGEKTVALLFYSAGHFRCAERGCIPVTWLSKEADSRSFKI